MLSCTFECGAAQNPSNFKGQAAEPWDPWCLPPPHRQPCPTHTASPSAPAHPHALLTMSMKVDSSSARHSRTS